MRASKTFELSDADGEPLNAKFRSSNLELVEQERISIPSEPNNYEQELMRKQAELSKSLKNQAKEILFLREESISAKQDLDNYRNFIEFMVIHTGFQIDQEDAERLKLRQEIIGH